MKKKLIVRIIAVILILVGVYVVARPKIHELTRANDIKNFLNEKSFANISKETKKRYKFRDETVTEYDISQIMSNYVNTVYEVVKSKDANSRYLQDFIFSTNNNDGSLIQVGFDNIDCDVLTRETTQEMLNEYRDGTFLDNFAEKLYSAIEGKVEHRSDWLMGDYYIKADTQFEIELPYNCYIKYTPRQVEILDKKECTDVKLKYRENIRNEVEANITYIDKEGQKQQTMYIEFRDSGWNRDDMYVNVYGWFYNIKEPQISIATKNRDEMQVTHPEYNESSEEEYTTIEENRNTRRPMFNGGVYTNDDVESRGEYEMDKNGRNGIWFMNDEGEYEMRYVDENGNFIEEETETTETETEIPDYVDIEETTVEETQETKKKSLVDKLKEREGR